MTRVGAYEKFAVHFVVLAHRVGGSLRLSVDTDAGAKFDSEAGDYKWSTPLLLTERKS